MKIVFSVFISWFTKKKTTLQGRVAVIKKIFLFGHTMKERGE